MRKRIGMLLAFVFLFSCLTGIAPAEEKKLSVVVTIFPVYDWVREVTGPDSGNTEITLLLDSGVDLHSYQPSAQDILRISTADLFVYVGGESDEWVEDVLASAMNPHLMTVNLLDAMGEDLKIEELVEGMEHDNDHDEEEKAHDHEHGEEADEHVWLSLRCAQKLTGVIAAAMAELDAAHAEAYRANAAAYTEKLAALDAQYSQTVENAGIKTILFGDRFPFRYLADDYGLTYYAAFAGCSAETEASFQTILFLAQKLDELGLPAVLTIENPKTRIAETVVNATQKKNQKILSLNSMQGVTAQEVKDGAAYLSLMESNLIVLRDALN